MVFRSSSPEWLPDVTGSKIYKIAMTAAPEVGNPSESELITFRVPEEEEGVARWTLEFKNRYGELPRAMGENSYHLSRCMIYSL